MLLADIAGAGSETGWFDVGKRSGAGFASKAAAGSGDHRHADANARSNPQFRIFIIDSGWNSPARTVLYENFELLRELHRETPIYLLGRARSVELMRQYPQLVGKDPIIRLHTQAQRRPGFHGFRLHLGLLKQPEEALKALQHFARFIGIHRDSADLEAKMRSRLRQEGLKGAIEICLHGEAHGVDI